MFKDLLKDGIMHTMTFGTPVVTYLVELLISLKV